MVGLLSALAVVFVTTFVTVTNGEIRGASAAARQRLVESHLLIVTVATERTDGFERYERSVQEFGLEGNLKVLGMGDEWKGGQMDVGVGGGVKVSMLAEALKEYKDKENVIIMFTDSYDVIFNANEAQILEKFVTEMNDARVVFSAEGFCWPDARLASQYPIVKSGKSSKKSDESLYSGCTMCGGECCPVEEPPALRRQQPSIGIQAGGTPSYISNDSPAVISIDQIVQPQQQHFGGGGNQIFSSSSALTNSQQQQINLQPSTQPIYNINPASNKRFQAINFPVQATVDGLRIVWNLRTRNRINRIRMTMQYALQLLATGVGVKIRTFYYAKKKECNNNRNNAYRAVNDAAAVLAIPRHRLLIIGEVRGCVAGNVQWKVNGRWTVAAQNPVSMPDEFDEIEEMRSDAPFVLILEKLCLLRQLIGEEFWEEYPNAILATNAAAGLPQLQYAGVRMSDLQKMDLEADRLLALEDSDRKVMRALENDAEMKEHPELLTEEEHGIILDNNSKIFQNLNGAEEDVNVETKAAHGISGLHNIAYNTRPVIVHGNGPSKIKLNEIGNYIGKSWSNEDGCIVCRENRVDLSDKSVSELPTVTMAVFVERATPFLEEFFTKLVEGNNYPAEKISLFLHNRIAYHNEVVEKFLKENKDKFAGVKVFETTQDEETDDAEREARKQSIAHSIGLGTDYYFTIDSEAHMDNPDFLKLLIEQNRPILAPKLSQPGKMWSNFWGAVSETGWYARSFDYQDIVHYKKLGVWNVPFIMNAFLIHKMKLKALEKAYDYDTSFDASMSFAKYCRHKGHFMFVDNLQKYGHLINPDIFDTAKFRPDLWELDNNRLDWEQRYLHPEYYKYLNDLDLPQPCPDVYDFPFFSKRMCWDIIESMENFGIWSNGKNEDTRIVGGYENVPTRDIHMKQIGFENEWLLMLNRYGRPMQEKVFTGYFHNPVESHMMFVVRYKPEEQASLRPHHDASTWTLDISLNRHGIDFEGGGVRFVRYNCSVIGHEQGWSILMPGRLTHYHEGLTTTKGTRYIAISFINP